MAGCIFNIAAIDFRDFPWETKGEAQLATLHPCLKVVMLSYTMDASGVQPALFKKGNADDY